MGKLKEPAFIEQCVVYSEKSSLPSISFNICADGDQLPELSYERLIAIRDLINQIESKMIRKEVSHEH
jgi:hypothetical protein